MSELVTQIQAWQDFYFEINCSVMKASSADLCVQPSLIFHLMNIICVLEHVFQCVKKELKQIQSDG